MRRDKKKPVRPWQPILTLLTQGVAPVYAGAAFPGLTKPVVNKIMLPLEGVNEKDRSHYPCLTNTQMEGDAETMAGKAS